MTPQQGESPTIGSGLPRPLPLRRREALMRRALDVAAGTPDGDVPVGAIVVGPTGTELAAATNRRETDADPTAHAELVAIRGAARALREAGRGDGWRLEDCTLVVTLEPCAMCAGAIVLSRIPRVVFGAWDEKAGAVGSVFDILREPRLNHWVEVYPGVKEAECAALLTDFFRARRHS